MHIKSPTLRRAFYVVSAASTSWNEIKDELIGMWQVVEGTDELSLLVLTR